MCSREEPLMRPFFYDAIARHRPWAIPLVQSDAQHLREQGVKTVGSCDQEPLYTHFLEYLHRSQPPLAQCLHLIGSREYREQFHEAVRSDTQLQQEFQTFFIEYCCLINFELSGRKVFYLDGGLVDRLAVTIADAPCELLRLPFPSCFFVIDYPPFLELYELMTKSPKPPAESVLSVSITEIQGEDGPHLAFFACRFEPGTGRYAATVKRSWMLSPERTVEDSLKSEWPREPGEQNADQYFFAQEPLIFFRTLANAILYISSRTADIVAKNSPLADKLSALQTMGKRWKKRNKEQATYLRRSYSSLDFFHAGGKIIVAPFRPFFSRGGIAELRRVLLHRLLVRGHWRLQPHGPQSSLRKLIFIEPYWRGPEMAVEVNKPYEVKL